jgi:hypothetical protein
MAIANNLVSRLQSGIAYLGKKSGIEIVVAETWKSGWNCLFIAYKFSRINITTEINLDFLAMNNSPSIDVVDEVLRKIHSDTEYFPLYTHLLEYWKTTEVLDLYNAISKSPQHPGG